RYEDRETLKRGDETVGRCLRHDRTPSGVSARRDEKRFPWEESTLRRPRTSPPPYMVRWRGVRSPPRLGAFQRRSRDMTGLIAPRGWIRRRTAHGPSRRGSG